MRSYLAALVTCSVLFAPPARAQEVEAPSAGQTSLGVGLRLGIAFPMGSVSGGGGPLGDYFSAAAPVGVDLGYFIDRSWFFGVYGQYGLARASNDTALLGACAQPGVACSGRALRVGVETWWRLGQPTQRIRAWAGVAVGYEWAMLRGEDATGSANLTLGGVELVPVQLGVDFSLGSLVTLGPYVALGLGRYSTVSVDSGSTSTSGDIQNASWHEWLHLGVKATLAP
jgi:hypothetical protein